jgi:hypothetical protein
VRKLCRLPGNSADGQVIGILSATGYSRNDVGFINPILYAAGSTVCRDILPAAAIGDNGVKGVAGYRAGPGWDACTGWGSPIGTTLLAVLGAAVPEHQLVASTPASAPTEA